MFNAINLFNFMVLAVFGGMIPQLAEGANMSKLYEIPVKSIEGKETKLSEYKGKVLLIVNTASECGFTSQYAGLESLYKKYKEKGLVVLGFPSNDFGGQEPGTEAEIKKFCELKYKTTFPMFSKLVVKGENAHPLYSHLQSQGKAEVKWNFGKFLIAKDGSILKYFSSNKTPEGKEIVEAVESALAR
jgi:glutathione peroxidase